jgi:MFS family permease
LLLDVKTNKNKKVGLTFMKFRLNRIKSSSSSSQPPSNNKKKNNANNLEKIPPFAWKVLFVLSAIATLVMYAETMISIAIPEIIREFDISYNTSSWILTIYLIVGGIMTPISGKLSDLYGRKKILLLVVAAYVLGVTLGGFSINIYHLLAARILQGIGMSFFPIAYSIIKDIFPARKMAIGQGIVTSMFASGSVLGILLGGPIIQYYGWNMTYYSLIPAAGALLIVVARLTKRVVQDNEGEIQQQAIVSKSYYKAKTLLDVVKSIAMLVDAKGAILLAILVTSSLLLLTSFENGTNNGNGDSININTDSDSILLFALSWPLLLAIAIASLLLFIHVERLNRYSPLVDFKLLIHKPILLSNILSLIVGFWTFVIFYTIPVLARNPSPVGFGMTSVDTSLLLLPFAVVLLIFGPTSGYIISRLGSTRPVLIGTILCSTGFVGLLFFHMTEYLVALNLVILSAGVSLTNVGSQNVVMLATPKQSSGMSLAMTSLLKLIGSAIGPALAAMYLQNYQYTSSLGNMVQHFPSSESYNLIFASSVIVSIISLALAIILGTSMNRGKSILAG